MSPLGCALRFSKDEGEIPQFQAASHLELISDAITDAWLGVGEKKIIISMPPRHGKSTLVTLRTPQWFLANNPELTVGMCGYGASFAADWGRRVRNNLIEHKDLVGFDLAPDSQKTDWWHTDQGGGMWTAGIGGGITGKGAHLLVIDDPIKSDAEAYSPTYRDHLWRWWMKDAMTRTYPRTIIVVVMTRWHTDDFVGRLLSHDYPGDPAQWRVITLPAIWDKDVPDALGRKRGDALWPDSPEEMTAEWLIANRKNTISPEAWESMFQQRPLNSTGLGAVYHNFDEDTHVREVIRDDRWPLSWALDFNVNPMTSVICQVKEEFARNAHLTNEKLVVCEVLKELVLPHSNTLEMCAEFAEQYRKLSKGRKVDVHVYGDATANRRDTRGTDSDWEQIWRFLNSQAIPFHNHVHRSNPLERDRATSMNMALKSPDGVVALIIDKSCRELKADLHEVRWKTDVNGNALGSFDKSDSKRTHISDALGYLIHQKFAVLGGGGLRAGSIR